MTALLKQQTWRWSTGSEEIEFHIYDSNQGWRQTGGLYVFCRYVPGIGWEPFYIGQTDNFSNRLPNHERLEEAIRRGVTHIHACSVSSKLDRDRLEAMLIRRWKPVMNEMFK